MPIAKRTGFIVAAVVVAVIVVGTLVVLSHGDDATEATPLTYTEFNPAGPTSVKTNEAPLWNTPQQLVFRNQADWAAKDLPYDSLRSVDFTKSMVVVYSMGQQSTGGYGVAITGVTGDEKKVTIGVTETAPGAGCATTQTLTTPRKMIEVPQAPEVAFDVKKETKDC
jgi:hypothetical protein